MGKSVSKVNKSSELSNYYPLIFTVLFVAFLFQYSFSSLESILYDLRVKWDIGTSPTSKIVLITQDEESDEFLGEQYPYTYSSHELVLSKILEGKPRVVNYFTQFNYPKIDSEVEQLNFSKFLKVAKDYIEKGEHIRFASNIKSGRMILPPAGLKDVGHSFGDIVVDENIFSKDDVLRRLVLSFKGEDSLHLWTSNTYREKIGLSKKKSNDYKGAYYSRESDAIFAMFRYVQNPLEYSEDIKQIPFHTVRVGNYPKDFFKNKIVLIGPSYISNPNDYLLTPYDRESFLAPKMMGHAVIIQALIENKTIYPVSRKFTYILSIIIAIVLSLIISHLKPTSGLVIIISGMLSVVLISYLLFISWGLWVYAAPIIISIFVVYYIWVPFRAIGEYQKNYAIQEETKLLKKVENLKQNFISLMSHDLKTPVAKIAGLAGNILQDKSALSETQINNTKLIVESTKELNNFITSILDLTKIESSNISKNVLSKDLNIVVENVINGLMYEAETKKVIVDKELAPLYPIQLDIVLMQRVISNLVENAIKYSGEGSRVFIKTWDDEKWVYLSIEDNGVGIPPEDVDNIFEKFYRIKNDASHSIKGTGLGLYLVKYFVELHDGVITVESDFGKGTKFLIKLLNK
jgi:signal transduction histidine kinase